MRQSKDTTTFFALLCAGLWETDVQLFSDSKVDFEVLFQMAEEQSVVGLVAAGIEHITDLKPQKKDVLQFIGRTVQLEQKNSAMNHFIGVLVGNMREKEINTLLVKGQGVAQCYERPLWRSCGDVDFFLDAENYEKAKKFLIPLAASVEKEYAREKHLGMTIDPWRVELHGTLYSGLSSKIEKELDDIYFDTFNRGSVRSWMDDNVKVFQLSVENELFYVFTHILQHFYKGGIGLRQVCDWCRLISCYRDELDVAKLERRLNRAGLMSEWRAFGAFAVVYLGMLPEAVPFLNLDVVVNLKGKAERIKDFIMMSGNFGHNRGRAYFIKYPYLVRKCISFGRRLGDLFRHSLIFPIDSLRFFPTLLINGVRSAARGE